MLRIFTRAHSIREFKTYEWEEECKENNKSRCHSGRLLTPQYSASEDLGEELGCLMKNPL